jgi:hypothetical protein
VGNLQVFILKWAPSETPDVNTAFPARVWSFGPDFHSVRLRGPSRRIRSLRVGGPRLVRRRAPSRFPRMERRARPGRDPAKRASSEVAPLRTFVPLMTVPVSLRSYLRRNCFIGGVSRRPTALCSFAVK